VTAQHAENHDVGSIRHEYLGFERGELDVGTKAFKKLGNFLTAFAHSGVRHIWKSGIYPGNVWRHQTEQARNVSASKRLITLLHDLDRFHLSTPDDD
jgi:hypothetical protein